MANRTIIYYFSWLILITIVTGCKKNYDDLLTNSLERKNYVPVIVEEVGETFAQIPIQAIGRVSSDTETQLSFKISGYVLNLYAREGDYVKKGKLLGELRTQEIDAQVLKAHRGLDKAQRDLERIQLMYKDSVATLENVQDLTTLVEISQADLEIARFNQQYASITSPVSGRILQRRAEPNELVSPGQPIFVIASSGNQTYVMNVHISDKDISSVSFGTKAKLSFDAYPGKEFEGIVSTISESADPLSGTFEIEISINVENQRLRKGLIGRAVLYPDDRNEYLKIPISSIAEGNEMIIKVFVPDQSDTVANRREMKVERFANDFVWVRSDQLNEKRIITIGSAYLKEGQVIKIVE